MIQVLFVANQTAHILALMPYADYRGLRFHIAENIHAAITILNLQPSMDVIIADHELSDGPGLDLLAHAGRPMLSQFFLAVDRRDLASERQALALGVKEILEKPIGIPSLEKIFYLNAQKDDPVPIQSIMPVNATHFSGLIGETDVMLQLYHLIKRVAPTKASAFIIGSSGSGKELVANAIHQCGTRVGQPYIAINCGAIPQELLGSALFGHEKGSFTGAIHAHKGYFEQASGGTLFLDEITETAQALQVSLLRVLETQTIMPVGGQHQRAVDVRILASTNRDPWQAVQQGILREDLYHRLNMFPINVPPLAARVADIRLLTAFFLSEYNHQYHTNTIITADALAYIMSLPYPGNVRQLKNILYRAYILADAVIEREHIISY